ncbi:MAG: TerB family tellurite resistance protein [Myxococcota bacterium]
MRFDPELTRKVRDLIISRGSLEPPNEALELDGMGHEGTPEANAVVRRVAPMAEALYLIMSADEVCRESERVALRGAIRTVTDGEAGDASIDALVDGFGRALAEQGLEARLDAVAGRLAADRTDSAVVLELAAAVIISDGEVHPAEREALEQLAERTGVDPDQALALLG